MRHTGDMGVTWTPFAAAADGETVACNYGLATGVSPITTLVIIPTYGFSVNIHEAEAVKVNVMTKWLDGLTSAGAGVILMHGIDDLWLLARWARSGKDGFGWLTRRIEAVLNEALRRGYGNEERLVILGSSRHGFASLHAMANLPMVSAAIAHQPIVWWPHLEEFLGMDDNPIVRRNDLVQWVDRFPPRPLLVQTGYDDRRAGQDNLMRLLQALARSYRGSGNAGRFTHELMDIPGHEGARVPDSALYGSVTWLRGQGLL